MLLWELIESELAAKPLALGDDPQRYLEQRMKRLKVAEEGFDRNIFLERLIMPSYHQGMVRLLLAAGVRLQLCGRGWFEIEEFREHSRGAVESMEEFAAALNGCAAVVHPSPIKSTHAADAIGCPILQPSGMPSERFIAEARKAAGGSAVPKRKGEPLSSERLVQLIGK